MLVSRSGLLADSLSSMSWGVECASCEPTHDILQRIQIIVFPRSWLDSVFLARRFSSSCPLEDIVKSCNKQGRIHVSPGNSLYSGSENFFLKTYIYTSSQYIFEHPARTSQEWAVPPASTPCLPQGPP